MSIVVEPFYICSKFKLNDSIISLMKSELLENIQKEFIKDFLDESLFKNYSKYVKYFI